MSTNIKFIKFLKDADDRLVITANTPVEAVFAGTTTDTLVSVNSYAMIGYNTITFILAPDAAESALEYEVRLYAKSDGNLYNTLTGQVEADTVADFSFGARWGKIDVLVRGGNSGVDLGTYSMESILQ